MAKPDASMTTVLQAPAKGEGRPGYKHTKLGWIPEEWEVEQLGRLGPISMCKRIFKDETTPAGDVPFFKIGTFGGTPDAFISFARYEEYKSRFSFPKVGDILISAAGTIGRTVVYDGQPAYFQDSNIVWIANDESLVTNSFLRYVYPNIRWETDTSTIPRLYNDSIKQARIAIPPLSEQRRIAQVMGAWDRAIATVQQLLAAQQERKRGLMQELLTGRRRFKGFGGKWRECELGELGQFRTSSVDKKLVDGQKRVRLVNYMDVYNNQRIHGGMTFMEVTAKDSQLQSSSLRRGDILFTPSSETPDDIGHSAVVVEDMANTLFSYHVMRFRPHDDALDIDFRAYVFNNDRILKQFSAKATGSTRYTLSASDFGDTLVSFPSDKAEQQAIARTLMACDAEIEALTNQLDHLTTQKRGLMQQLLTGAVRVKV